MSEKRFVAQQIDVVNEDETEVWDIVFDTEDTYAFMVRDTDTASDLCEVLNEQQDIITEQKEKVARVLNEYSRQFKRHSKEFSFMLDLAEDLGVKSLEAKDD